MAQWVKHLLGKHGGLSLDPQHPLRKLSCGSACLYPQHWEEGTGKFPAAPWQVLSIGQLQVQF